MPELEEYLRLPNHQKKVLGIQNMETMQESMDELAYNEAVITIGTLQSRQQKKAMTIHFTMKIIRR